MGRITVLDEKTIDKIAAGEVIERPASVVKELLENAIDAKATAITVEIKEGGISLIRVTDNGSGIGQEDIPLAFLRHSTSKITSVEDLFLVSSLGFRGEALSSIAAVSQVELLTKTSRSPDGHRYQIDGGKSKNLETVGVPEGTTFVVRNLFFNTPVRKKFLKSPQTESGYIANVVEKLALSHPEISFRFIQNNQNKLHTSGNHNIKDIIYTIFGREITANLLEIQGQNEIMAVSGFAGKPLVSRGNRNYENYFINGRYIKSGLISKAIEEAYKPYLMQHKYPFTVLYLTIEPELLDVNVHPTKMELRFREEALVYQAVYNAVQQALECKELIPDVKLDSQAKISAADGVRKDRVKIPEPFETRRMAGFPEAPELVKESSPVWETHNASPPVSAPLLRSQEENTQSMLRQTPPVETGAESPPPCDRRTGAESPPPCDRRTGAESPPPCGRRTGAESPPSKSRRVEMEQRDFFGEKLLEPSSRVRHRLIGQLFGTYWLVEFGQQLYIIDQHAAHEKVLYEKNMASLKTREYTSQMLNPPIIMTLNPAEEILLNKYKAYFSEIGFEIEHFGGKEYAVRALPDNVFSIAKKDLLIEMIDSLSENFSGNYADMICERLATMSCKAAVKGNHTLSAAEMDALIDQLLQLENPYTCPHGRPTIISMSKYELERKFKRII